MKVFHIFKTNNTLAENANGELGMPSPPYLFSTPSNESLSQKTPGGLHSGMPPPLESAIASSANCHVQSSHSGSNFTVSIQHKPWDISATPPKGVVGENQGFDSVYDHSAASVATVNRLKIDLQYQQTTSKSSHHQFASLTDQSPFGSNSSASLLAEMLHQDVSNFNCRIEKVQRDTLQVYRAEC